MRVYQDQEREVNTRSGRKQNSLVRVCAKLFWSTIYCANPRPKPESQSGSLYRIGLVRWSPQIIRKYNLAPMFEIRPSNQPRTCKMGYSIFANYDQGLLYKNEININNKQRKLFPMIVAMITMLLILLFFLLGHERFHWILLVAATVWVPQSDVNDYIIMKFPWGPDEDVTFHL